MKNYSNLENEAPKMAIHLADFPDKEDYSEIGQCLTIVDQRPDNYLGAEATYSHIIGKNHKGEEVVQHHWYNKPLKSNKKIAPVPAEKVTELPPRKRTLTGIAALL